MTTAPDRARMPRRQTAWTATLLLAGLYPFSIVLGTNFVIEPLDPWAVGRAILVSLLASVVLFLLLRPVVRDGAARAQWLVVFLLCAGSYGLVINTLNLWGVAVTPTSGGVAIAYVVVTAALATAVSRPWVKRRRDAASLAIVAVILVGGNTARAVVRWWADPVTTWRAAADTMRTPAKQTLTGTAPARDIYYIVLDGFGRADTLGRIYDLDATPFVTFLRANGFFVADQARSNYAQTLLSFSSILNLDYLDTVGSAAGVTSGSRAPLDYLIQHNALMILARRAGYRVVGIGTDYATTKRFKEADVCVCGQHGLDIFEQAVIAKTPLVALPLDTWSYGAHRAKILDSLDALTQAGPASAPRFVFAHILAPHPPFTFAADGIFHRPPRPFMFNDGSDFEGSRDEYVRGYHDQAAFVIAQLTTIVQTILSRPGPRPVIVLHGDHGPGSMLHVDDPARTNLPERMNIFAAYAFPEHEDLPYASITPVSGVRLLANAYLGTTLPHLDDRSWFSTWTHPYDFVAVAPEGGLPKPGSK